MYEALLDFKGKRFDQLENRFFVLPENLKPANAQSSSTSSDISNLV